MERTPSQNPYEKHTEQKHCQIDAEMVRLQEEKKENSKVEPINEAE